MNRLAVFEAERHGGPVWLYRTQGLAPARADVELAVARRSGETEAPEEPWSFLANAYDRLLEQAPIEPLRVETLSPRLLGFDGFGVVRARDGGPALELVLLTKDELAVAQRQGLPRVLSMLGEHPAPSGAVRGRKSAATIGGLAESILAGGATQIPGLFAVWEGSTLTLVVLEEARERLADLLANAPSNATAVFATEPHPHAERFCGDAFAGHSAPKAFPRKRASAVFVAVLPEKLRDELELVEDGVLLSLTGASWSRLRQALVAGDDLELALSWNAKLVLDWKDAWSDLTGVAAASGAVRIGDCLVFGSDEDVAERVGREPLDALIRSTLETARRIFATEQAVAHGLKIRATLRAPRSCAWMVTRPVGMEAGRLDAFIEALTSLPAPRATETIAFELTLAVVGGAR